MPNIWLKKTHSGSLLTKIIIYFGFFYAISRGIIPRPGLIHITIQSQIKYQNLSMMSLKNSILFSSLRVY
jgi:hypothetical protein